MLDLAHTWTPESLKQWTDEVGTRNDDGSISPVRPLCYFGLCLRKRLRMAWRVLVGKADVLEWTDK